MKLYTEEQVKQIAKQIMDYGFHDVSDFKNYDNPITPIELPTDEEIVNMSGEDDDDNLKPSDEFKRGAKYVINKIQGGNK